MIPPAIQYKPILHIHLPSSVCSLLSFTRAYHTRTQTRSHIICNCIRASACVRVLYVTPAPVRFSATSNRENHLKIVSLRLRMCIASKRNAVVPLLQLRSAHTKSSPEVIVQCDAETVAAAATAYQHTVPYAQRIIAVCAFKCSSRMRL